MLSHTSPTLIHLHLLTICSPCSRFCSRTSDLTCQSPSISSVYVLLALASLVIPKAIRHVALPLHLQQVHRYRSRFVVATVFNTSPSFSTSGKYVVPASLPSDCMSSLPLFFICACDLTCRSPSPPPACMLSLAFIRKSSSLLKALRALI